MSDNTRIQYALRLPNGELAHDIRHEFLHGNPKSEVLPNGAIALLWGKDQAHDVSRTRAALAEEVKKWGLADLVKKLSTVVQVRTTVEILDGTKPAADDAGGRWFGSAANVPYNIQARIKGIANAVTYERFSADEFKMYRDGVATGAFLSEDALDGARCGNPLVEVQP